MVRRSHGIVWSAAADEDLIEIWQYFSSQVSPRAAIEKLRDIARTADRLEQQPLLGRPRDELRPGMRSVLAQPYVVFYRVEGRTVKIVRVVHGRRDFEAIFAESEW